LDVALLLLLQLLLLLILHRTDVDMTSLALGVAARKNLR